MKKFVISNIALCILVFVAPLQAQNSITASGGNALGSGGSISYTIGQVVYTAITGSNGSVALGVQHPYEISIVTNIEESLGISLEIVVYPNPAIDYIKLKIETNEIQNLRYHLFDINGTLIQNNKIVGDETYIFMNNYMSAIYFLKVTYNNKVVKTFKIIKK